MKERNSHRNDTVCVVGLGYVGLPTAVLAVEKGCKVIGVDIKPKIVESINDGKSPFPELPLDTELERHVSEGRFRATENVGEAMDESDVVLVIVPTPLTSDGEPDLSCLVSASRDIGRNLRKGQLIIFESTVYPGCTEEVCLPILESESGLKAGSDFALAYCPERYNPADEEHTIERVSRVVGAIDDESLIRAVEFYRRILLGTIHPVSGIREAEATKVLENSQRNVNIAFMNEMAKMFEKMGLDSHEIIRGASTKFNFVKVCPGPGVGGHCIPVDPYYLIYKSLKSNFVPRLLLTACEINDSMPKHLTKLIERSLDDVGKDISSSKIAILGVAYKPDVGDIRESPAGAVISELKKHHGKIAIHDPLVNVEDVKREFGLENQDFAGCLDNADCVVLLTDHNEFRKRSFKDIAGRLNNQAIIVDSRGVFDPEEVNGLGVRYYRLGDGKNNGN